MNICEYCFKISSHNNEPIFSGELVEIGHYELHVPKHLTEDFNKVYIKLTLRYEDGKKDEMLMDVKETHEVIIQNSEEIKEYITKDHPNFVLSNML